MSTERSEAPKTHRASDSEISLLELASVILRRRRVIIRAVMLGGVAGLAVAVFSPTAYTADMSFLPHASENRGLSNVAGLAQQFGFTLPGTTASERSPEFYRDLLESREVLDELAATPLQIDGLAGPEVVYLPDHFEVAGDMEEQRAARTVRHLREEVISVAVGRETGIVSAEITTDDPRLSAAVAGRLLELLTTFDLETRQSQASEERQFAEGRLAQLQAELAVAEDSLKTFLGENRLFDNSPQLTFENDRLQRQVQMRQQLVTAMAEAFERARIEEVRSTPVITVVDQPRSPALPDSRGILPKSLLGLMVGLIAGTTLAFIRESVERARLEEGNEYRELESLFQESKHDLFGLLHRRRAGAEAAGEADES